MGFNTVLFICNDAMGAIDKDPVGWWQKVKEHLGEAGNGPVSFGFGGHGIGFEVVSMTHADYTTIIAAGGNHSTVLLQQRTWGAGIYHHTPEGRVELLKLAAERLGHTVVRASVRLRKLALERAKRRVRDKASIKQRSYQIQLAIRELGTEVVFLEGLIPRIEPVPAKPEPEGEVKCS